ncbi:FtsW/RodA/SpoVE family cell cycle protein [Lactobacillus mulieris]|uniref:Rod shape-determining protein RodA n=1 Tax=Lactobacillus mulieris TaxID=2508708 RepID=A0AAW5WXT1_9LACO|nr:FtsW/RodA/SpoVE family cell cycle protein [Lactobacillus mulieris]MCZ3622287.1 rod shape-determining protein RodA [Lactobacillus mulieris]MCZ3623925.1 rod shape-determining protein RodA [Lactobacillus mulieris]MCZ3636294.1 rod shape-determining protein RodA [Lactobacillus mulieris]MCZ3689838.1 rod shape-determining protein RodA [Lactobacillus mulieris]MCZ3695841.1 rod shape-determining protein RodA [Lactobacillus mulieris]
MAKLQNKTDIYDRVAWGIVGAIALLAIISFYAIWIAASNDSTLGTPFKAVIGQAVWYILSIAIVIVIMQFDADQLFKIAPYAYALGIILLILVLIFYDRSSFVNNGAKSWFKLGSLTFQPSEVMKPAFILMLARVVKDHNEYYGHTWRNDWLLLGKIFAWLAPIAVLLKLQNDFGTMLVFFAIVGGVILVSGITWKIIVPTFIVIAVLGTTTILLVTTSWGQAFLGHFFKAYQFERINSWLDPSGDTSSGAYQLWQSMKAIGSGQIFGSGFGKSSVYVPVRSSDMVFSVLGESFGFVGGVVLIMIYLYLIIQMVMISFDTRNAFYSYISTGIIMMILFHVFENIGMSIDLLPLTGIPLPFVSQGGSALIGNMIGIGLILSMKFHNKDYIFSTAGDF